MNIIEIAVLLSVDAVKIGTYTKTELAEMAAFLEEHKKNQPTLTDESVSRFFNALRLKKNIVPLQAVLANRALFNFFAKKNLSRKQFPDPKAHENEDVKRFIQTYLIDDLQPKVLDSIKANDFQEISLLMEAHELLPDRISEKILYYANEKLDLAIRTLKPPFGDFSQILYIRDAHFFVFLNGLKSEALEEKVKVFFSTLMNMYIADKSSELARRTFTAMKNYEALDAGLYKEIGMLKESAELNFKPFAVNRKKYYWIYAIVGLLVSIRLWLFFGDLSEMNSQYDSYQNYDSYETEKEPRKLDPYYTEMKFRIDSFRIFLAEYNHDQIRRLTKISDIKTGQNPFETFYQNEPTGDSNNYLTIKNKSNYDMVLLENAVLYDSIKIPRTAHFVKAGESVEVNFNSEDAKAIFNVYVGKKMATFQTESNHLFIRNGSIVEYRFSELVPNVKEVMETGYILKNDANLDFVNGRLRVDSKGVIQE